MVVVNVITYTIQIVYGFDYGRNMRGNCQMVEIAVTLTTRASKESQESTVKAYLSESVKSFLSNHMINWMDGWHLRIIRLTDENDSEVSI